MYNSCNIGLYASSLLLVRLPVSRLLVVKFLENLLMDIIRTFNPYVVEEKAVRLGMMVYTCNSSI